VADPVDAHFKTLHLPGLNRSPEGHGRRFALAYVLLALVAGGAAAGLVLALGHGSKPRPVAWSSWQPSSSETAQSVREIADFVAGHYRLTASGKPLVSVVASPVAPQDIRYVVVRSQPTLIVDPQHTQMYALCGYGDKCAIAQGRPTHGRFELLRREALELALYTFKYTHGVDAVVVFFPPPAHGPTPSLFFRRVTFRPQLDQPLVETLRPAARLVPGRLTDADESRIDKLTDPSLFRFAFTRLNDGTPVLLLQPAV
jgi:hypothetical protein